MVRHLNTLATNRKPHPKAGLEVWQVQMESNHHFRNIAFQIPRAIVAIFPTMDLIRIAPRRGLASIGWMQYIGYATNQSVFLSPSIPQSNFHIASRPGRGTIHGSGHLRGSEYTLAGAFDRRDLKPTSKQQDRAGSPTGREIQGHETAKNLCRTAIANVSNGVNRHAPGGKDYMYSLLKRSLDTYAWRK